MIDFFRSRSLPRRPRSGMFSILAVLACATLQPACGGDAGGSSSVGRMEQDADQPAQLPGQGGRTTEIRIGGLNVTAEIADNPDLRARGLMDRDSLAPNHGMLFVYGTTQVRSFWMRNTRIPLDIAFIDANGVIINIEQMEPQSDQNYYSQWPMMYALEMSLGWFEANGIGPGDRLEF